MPHDYFPAKLAQGSQFCNRSHEKKILHENINKCRHTVLVAPRRYGKSSLVYKVIDESTLPLASIDLFLAHDDNAVIKRILTGIGQAVSKIMPRQQKMLAKLQNIFSNFRVSLTAKGFNIDASVETVGFDPVDQVFSALQVLSELAKQQQKKTVVFIDEFQDIREASRSKSIQGAIRHVAQETSQLMFIFSGSNRRLLLELFDDKSKPLYMLCDMLHLERINSQDYFHHIQALAKEKWGGELSAMVFDKIIALTELHPYYINLLCHELWKSDTIPDINTVFSSWETCYIAHEDRLIAELEKLTSKQQDILKALSLYSVAEPTGYAFVSAAKTPASTIKQIIKTLLNKDMIYKVKQRDDALPDCKKDQLKVLDPLLAYALKKYA